MSGMCLKALAGNRGVNVMNELDGKIQAFCIFCKEQIRAEKISSAAPETFNHVCPHCGEIYLGPEQEEDFYRFFRKKNDLVACNTQKREIYAPASCLMCRQPLKAYLIDDEHPNGCFWACFDHGVYIFF